MNDYSDKRKKKPKVAEQEVKYAKPKGQKNISGVKNSVSLKSSNIKYIQLKNIISDFTKLKSNWDSYNAEPVSKKAIAEAENILDFLDRNEYLTKNIINVFPMRDGGIQFEFDNDFSSSELEIDTNGNLAFISFDSDGNIIKQERLYNILGFSACLEEFNYV